MSLVAPTLQAFFTERLIGQRQASPHTVAAYRDTFRLLFAYLAHTIGKSPAELDFDDLGPTAISGFLAHLEQERGVSAATHNARLAALRSLFRYRVPSAEDLPARVCGVLAVLFLVFNEGCLATGHDTDPLRQDLTAEAVRLTHLIRALLPYDGEVAGLLALMVLTEARHAARVSATRRGTPVAVARRAIIAQLPALVGRWVECGEGVFRCGDQSWPRPGRTAFSTPAGVGRARFGWVSQPS